MIPYLLTASSTSLAKLSILPADSLLFRTLRKNSADCRKLTTANRLAGIRNKNILQSSDGRKLEHIKPTVFTGQPYPSTGKVSDPRGVVRSNASGPHSSLR